MFLRFFPQAPPCHWFLTALFYTLDYASLFIALFLHNLIISPSIPLVLLSLRIMLHTLYIVWQKPIFLLLAKLATILTLLTTAPSYLLMPVLFIQIISAGVYSFTRSQQLQDSSLDAQLHLLPLFISQSCTYASVCLVCFLPSDCVSIVLVQLVINQACLNWSRLYHRQFHKYLHHINIALLMLNASLLLFPFSVIPLVIMFGIGVFILGVHLWRSEENYCLEGDQVQSLIVLSQLVKGEYSRDKQYAKLQLIEQIKEENNCKEDDLQDYFQLKLKSPINPQVQKLSLFYAPSSDSSHPSLTYTRLLLSLSSTSPSVLPYITRHLSSLKQLYQTLLSSRISADHVLSLLPSISYQTQILSKMESDSLLYHAFRDRFLPFLPHRPIPLLSYQPAPQVEISFNHIVASSLSLIKLTGFPAVSPVLKVHLLCPPDPMVYLPHRTLYSVFITCPSPFLFQWQYSLNAVICVTQMGQLIALNELCAYFNIPPHPSTPTIPRTLLLELNQLNQDQGVPLSHLFDILLPCNTCIRLLKTVSQPKTIHYIQLYQRKQPIMIDFICSTPPQFGFYWNMDGISNIAPTSPLIFPEEPIVLDLPISLCLNQDIITMRLSNHTIDYIENFQEEDQFQSYPIIQDSSLPVPIDNTTWFRVGSLTLIFSICSFLALFILIYINTLSMHSSAPLRLLSTIHKNNMQYNTAILLSTLTPIPPFLTSLLNASLSTAEILSSLDEQLSSTQSSLNRLNAITNIQILLNEKSNLRNKSVDILEFQRTLKQHLTTYEQLTSTRINALVLLNYLLFALGVSLAFVYSCIIIRVNNVAHSQLHLALQKWKAIPVSTIEHNLAHIESFVQQYIHQREPSTSLESDQDAVFMNSRRLLFPSKSILLCFAIGIPLIVALLLISPFLSYPSVSVTQSYLSNLHSYLTHLQTTYVLFKDQSLQVSQEIALTYDSEAAMIVSFRELRVSITPAFLSFHQQLWNGQCCLIYSRYNLTDCNELTSGSLVEGSTQLVAYLNRMYDAIAMTPYPQITINYIPYLIPILTHYIPVLQQATHSEFLENRVLPSQLTPLFIVAVIVVLFGLVSFVPLKRMHDEIDRSALIPVGY